MPYKDKDKQAEARKRYEEKRKKQNGERHKVWTGIFYPDSAPPEDEWREAMSQMHLKIWVSPPHDADEWTAADERKNPAHKAGTRKKNHRHYIAEYEVQVDLQTFLDDFAFLNGGHNVKYVRSLRSMVRYLCHLDDPDKAEYNYVKDVDYISGAAILLPRQLWQQIGGFDERYAPAYCEDSDLAFEVRRAGYRVVYQPLSKVIHFEGISNGRMSRAPG